MNRPRPVRTWRSSAGKSSAGKSSTGKSAAGKSAAAGTPRSTAPRSPVAPTSSAARTVAAVAFALAAVCYASWLLGPVLNPGLGPIDSYLSELAARDQPYHRFFQLGDVATGLCAATAGLVLLRVARDVPRPAWWGALVFGVATAVDGGYTTMDCAPSVDARCARLEELGDLSWRHQAHTVTSSVAVAGGLLSLVVILAVLRGPARRRVGLAVAVVLLVGTVGTLVAAVRPEFGLGLWQRAQLIGLSGWLLLAAGVARWGPHPEQPR
ncbi:DUF998 domain-containing protein [Micromonospora sp. NPDC051925]|uniref:DUF998 domain-containing protein n=1 Tax=Micromonospora sp. NPDC051925 TaxID=3364288 RepID=UPI0037C64DE4